MIIVFGVRVYYFYCIKYSQNYNYALHFHVGWTCIRECRWCVFSSDIRGK